jgi:LuxR family maltose regulon positive regulatory protein
MLHIVSATVREGDGSAARRRPALAPVLSPKFSLPRAPAAAVRRAGLTNRLGTVDGPAVVAISAPVGYGKTTLLGEWADEVPGATYVALERHDDDPVSLLASLATALGHVEPVDPTVTRLLSEPGHALQSTLLPRLVESLWVRRTPTVLMIDDADHLRAQASLDVIASLMLHLPPSMRLAVASRHRLPLPWARLEVAGRLLELDAQALALDASDAAAMAEAMGVPTSSEWVASLVDQTEGWPAAIYLGLRAVGSTLAQGRSEDELRGTERSLAAYMRSELIEPLDEDSQRWLLRSSVLETMTGPLCDAAVGTTGSLARLREFEDRNMLVVPLDRHRQAYRYHRLLRDMLRDELEVRDPGAAAEVAARAAAWCAGNDDHRNAIEYAYTAGDMDLVARLVIGQVFPMHWTGRMATLSQWLDWFDRDGERERRAALAVMAGWVYALDGQATATRKWLASAERSQDGGPMPDGSAKEAWLALLRGFTAPRSLASLVADGRTGLEGIGDESPFRQTALILAGLADIAAGAIDTADERMAEAEALSEARSAIPGIALALGERALIAFARGDVSAARRWVDRGLMLVDSAGLGDYAASGLLHAMATRSALAAGSPSGAREAIARVNRLRTGVTAAVPIIALQMRCETIRACIALGDASAARALLLEARDILRQFPDLGTLAREVAVLERDVDSIRTGSAGPWSLTAAELRLLAYLPTHLSFREIAERLYVSPHTVKSQAMAVYGKLGVSSRRGAIESGVEAGLLDAAAIRMPEALAGSADT